MLRSRKYAYYTGPRLCASHTWGNGYASSAQSNFAPHPFVFDGIQCASVEGLLQAFKFKEPAVQAELCKSSGTLADMEDEVSEHPPRAGSVVGAEL